MRRFVLALVATALFIGTATAGELYDDLIYHDQQQAVFDPGYTQNILPGGCTKPDIIYGDKGSWNKWDQPGYWNDQYWPPKVPRYYQKRDKYSQFDFSYSSNNLYAPGNEWRWAQRSNQRRVIVDRRNYRSHRDWWNGTPDAQYWNYYNDQRRRRNAIYDNWNDRTRRPNDWWRATPDANYWHRQNDWRTQRNYYWDQRNNGYRRDRYYPYTFNQRRWDNHGNWYQPRSTFQYSYDIGNRNSRSYGYSDGTRMVTGFDSPTTSFRFGMNNRRSYYDPFNFSTGPSFSFGLNIRR